MCTKPTEETDELLDEENPTWDALSPLFEASEEALSEEDDDAYTKMIDERVRRLVELSGRASKPPHGNRRIAGNTNDLLIGTAVLLALIGVALTFLF